MARHVLVVVEDDKFFLELLVTFLPSVTGCARVIGCSGLAAFEAAAPTIEADARVVLVTDGHLGDDVTCAEVVARAVELFGDRMRNSALLLSGDPMQRWAHVFSWASAEGFELAYRQKPASIEDIEAWWRGVKGRFLS